jgi:hypothetical protein
VLAALGALLATPAVASACSIDGLASLSVNGNLAIRTTDTATAATVATWAPFSSGLAYAPGSLLTFSEDRGKLIKPLPAAAFKTPFRWVFGDGTSARGMRAAHRYARVGWHKVTVWSFWPSQRQWVQFDSIRVHILPPDQAAQANLGYHIQQALIIATQTLAYLGWLIVALPIWWWQRRKARRRAQTAAVTPTAPTENRDGIQQDAS